MNTPDNIRSRTTEKLIEDAYLKLLNQDPDHSVSVTMLCQEVGINRATFYSHYEDIYDLQQKLEERTTAGLMEIFKDRDLGNSRVTYQRLVVILEYIKAHRAFYHAFFRSGRLESPKAIEYITHKFATSERSRYKIIFYRAGISAIIRDWLMNSCNDPVELVAGVISEIYTL